MTTNASVTVTTPSEREIMMTRLFDAPRNMVFDCYTKPALLRRWMFPAGWQMTVCDNDVRAGGAFRWEWQSADGRAMGMSGIYREVVRPERIARTEISDQDWTGGEALGTVLLAEYDGTTVVTMSVVYSSREARDGALKSGMKDGVVASYAKLDALLASEISRAQSAA
ncbi:MAG: SRPBCC family protein [Pseudorhodoplanes sp.]|nr:SRPBCC family protein [Pseudorhodoplanes sp.]